MQEVDGIVLQIAALVIIAYHHANVFVAGHALHLPIGEAQIERARHRRAPPSPYAARARAYAHENVQLADPTTLILIDEADRLKMAALEQVRDLFDQGQIGVILMGMPGLEKRLARYPQLYSRVGFVHAFRPLTAPHVRELLRQEQWRPAGVSLAAEALADEEALAAIIRSTGGNFRLLHRLLAQIARLLELNELTAITPAVVAAARESLVLGVA